MPAFRRCETCDQELAAQLGTGPRRRFCSNRCRQAGYRRRIAPPAALGRGLTPAWSTETAALYTGDAGMVLQQLPARSVHCVVTSPPYFGLRDYEGQPEQLGAEPTVQAYVQRLVHVFREVRRVLRSDGTVWLNLGDSYSGRANAGPSVGRSGRADRAAIIPGRVNTIADAPYKSLLGIPARVALALVEDRWVWRNEIIWDKPNPQRTTAVDRLMVAHEPVMLFVKGPRYHFDLTPLRIPSRRPRNDPTRGSHPDGANPGDVWTVSTNRTKVGHMAAYPTELAYRAIAAGCPTGGVVLDPFSGSGTTGVAALQLDRRYIGIDLHEPYNQAAAARLAAHPDKENPSGPR